MEKIEEAFKIAENEDVSTPCNSVVLYSISYLPTSQNKLDALQFIKQNPQYFTLDKTVCGKKLIELGLEGKCGEIDATIKEIWAIASKRFILSASGNIRAFVKDADYRSTFVSIELPTILENKKINLINGIDKKIFAKQFGLYPRKLLYII